MNRDAFLLCLDFGMAKVGVAVGSLIPATPLDVIRYSSVDHLYRQVLQVVEQERPEGVLLGWPADTVETMTPATKRIREFGDELGRLTKLPVIYYPETLTTQQASKRMIAAGVSQKRRRLMEDSYAAAAILEGYLQGLE